MKKTLILVIAALMIPGAALAAKSPSHHAPKKPAQVTYVLKGTLSAFTAYNADTMTNGSITILVKHAEGHAKSLKGQTLTFAVDANTKVDFHKDATTITDGDNGVVKVRAAKKIAPADLATTLQASPAKQVIDQGAPKAKH